MEILILIGIFAFVVAILFRSNEALDRVGEVEKEVKMLEEEVTHTETPEVSPEEKLQPVQESVVAAEMPIEPAIVSPETLTESIPVVEVRPHVESVPEEQPTENIFPKPEDVHMNS